ncbi:TPA: ATP/GTP-binding protein, partial [Serratia marcescens]
MIESLSRNVDFAVVKYLSAVDINPKRSNQHEIGGLVKAGLSRFLPGPQNGEKLIFDAIFICLNSKDFGVVHCEGKLTWYNSRHNQRNRLPEYRMYYKGNIVSSKMQENDFFIIGKTKSGEFFIIISPSGTEDESYLRNIFGFGKVVEKKISDKIGGGNNLLKKISNEQKVKTTNQLIDNIYFRNLKCLQEVNISFAPKNVTAIFGPNGSGKSTILHALASLFQPEDNGENYRFSDFFPRNPDAEWNGSYLEVTHSYRKGKEKFEKELDSYGKAEQKGSRWTKIYARRPYREVYYMGIGQCVPMIESEKNNSSINYITINLKGEHESILLRKASDILNRKYSSFNKHELQSGKTCIGVETDEVKYSALSMSAGEQKVFFILDKVFSAGKNSLILIDEIDLLLHDKALKRLIEVIVERVNEKNIQVVFTTHRESLLELSELINVRHVVNFKGKTLCFNETKPDAINRLTGKSNKSIEIFVEDSFSLFIIQYLCSKMKAMRHVSISVYGAASNAFTIISGLLLKNDDCENVMVVIDGDEYKSENSKRDAINRVLTGTDARVRGLRDTAINKIKQFNLPGDTRPENFIHSLLCDLNENEVSDDEKEI